MWRLLIVLALCGAPLVKGEEAKYGRYVSCNNITTMQNVSMAELQGTWTAQNYIQKDGWISQPSICFLNEISVTVDNGLTMVVESRLEGDEKKVNKESADFKVTADNEGRWTSVHEKSGYDLLLISGDLSNYIVLALCPPLSNYEITDDLEETIVFRVHFFTRRQEGSVEIKNFIEKNLAKITEDTVKTLGLQSYVQGNYSNPNC